MTTAIGKKILKVLREHGPSTRDELVNQLKKPRTTLYRQLVLLQSCGAITSFTKRDGESIGRPNTFFALMGWNDSNAQED